MGSIAAWVTARPVNTVLGLALSLLLPFVAQIVSGALMVTVVLAQGAQQAVLKGGAALLLLAVLFLAFGVPVGQLGASAAIAWLPAGLLALLLRRTRSLTLVMQVAALAAIGVTVGFHVVLADPVEFWSQRIAEFTAMAEEMGFAEYAASLSEQTPLLARQMTTLFVLVSWSMLVLVVGLGYALFQRLPDCRALFGRFCDVNLGRVLAIAMAVASLSALAISAEWLQNVAFVMFAVFWVQGLAILHWLQVEGVLPVLALFAVYALLAALYLLLVTPLAVLGYTDAWFDYRARIAARRRGNRSGRG